MMSDSDRADQMGQATREKLRQFIARIERLEGEKAELASDIRDVYAEMKTFGLDTKVMRAVIKLRKADANERAELDALTELYMDAADGTGIGSYEGEKKSKKSKNKKDKKSKKKKDKKPKNKKGKKSKKKK